MTLVNIQTTLLKIGLCATALVCGSCTERSSPPANDPLSAPPLALELSAEQALAWAYHHELSSDLDGDNSPETVVLASDVQLSARGVPLWEDGHRWALVVQEGDRATLVYSAFVPHGFVEAAILQASSERRREVLVQERTPNQLRALAISYEGPGRARSASAAYYQIESWFPESATLRD